MNPFMSQQKALSSDMMGLDFVAFYTAGTFVREGRSHDLYDIPKVFEFEQQVARKEKLELKRVGPWWNPPFYALPFAGMSTLSFKSARDLWIVLNFACLLTSAVLLVRMLPDGTHWKNWALVPVLLLVSMPTIQAMSHGQNTGTSLLILTGTVALWRKARNARQTKSHSFGGAAKREPRTSWAAFGAGACAGLLFYKPQLGAVMAASLTISLGMPALFGLLTTGTILLVINLLVLPGTIGDFLHHLPANVHFMQVERAYMWERHVTLKAFWRLLLQGRSAGEMSFVATALTWVTSGSVGIALIHGAIRNRAGKLERMNVDRIISATIAATPLLMPFYFDYDLMLLAIPAVLFACEWLSADAIDKKMSLVCKLWIGLYCVLLMNPSIGALTRFNPAVVLLTAIALVLIGRTLRYNVISSEREEPASLLRAA